MHSNSARGWTAATYSHEVERAIKAAANVGDIDIKGELIPEEIEHLVVVIVLHEINTRANVGAIRMLSDELQAERIAVRLNAVGALIVGAVDTALLSTGLAIGADALVPGGPLVAVGGSFNGVPLTCLALCSFISHGSLTYVHRQLLSKTTDAGTLVQLPSSLHLDQLSLGLVSLVLVQACWALTTPRMRARALSLAYILIGRLGSLEDTVVEGKGLMREVGDDKRLGLRVGELVFIDFNRLFFTPTLS